jgi:hypothetical protein
MSRPAAGHSPLGALATSILDEAAGLMDDIQDGLAQVAGLLEHCFRAPPTGNPTRLPSMLTSFTDAAGGASSAVSGIGSLLWARRQPAQPARRDRRERNAQSQLLRLPRHRGIARGRSGELAAARHHRRSVDWIRPCTSM